MRRIDSKGFKEFHQKRLDEKKFFAEKKLQEEKKILKEQKKRQEIKKVSEELRHNWRDDIDLQENNWSPTTGSGPTNSIAQRFAYSLSNLETGQPNTVTVSGLGGVESIPSTVSVDFGFGETEVVSAPTFSQLGLQGYAKPLGTDVRRRRDYEDVNPRLDASQEFARAVGADYMMNARVDDGVIPNYTSTPDAPLIAQIDPQYLDKDGLLDQEKMDALFRDDPDEFIRQIQKGLAPKPPTVLPDVAPVEGETILPQALQDALNRRRNNPPPVESTRDKMDKKQILDFLDTPEGKKFAVTNPEQYDEFINILTGGKGSLSPKQPGFRPPVQPPRDSYGDFLRNGGMINPTASAEGLANVADMIQSAYSDFVPPQILGDLIKGVTDALTPLHPAYKYKGEIAQSIMSNRPIDIPQSEIPANQIKAFVNGIANNESIIDHLIDNYSETEIPYSDDNFYELPNGEVRAHTPKTRKLYPPNTSWVGDGNRSNPIAGQGEAQLQLIAPKDGQPYIKYRDHAYHNLESKSKDELPNILDKVGSDIIHSLAGKTDPKAPNTGEMSNHPSNIKGDVTKTIVIPYSELPSSSKLRRAVNDKIGLEQQRAAGINVGSPEVNTGTGRDGTFGRGTYGQGRPSDPKSSYTFDKETGEPQYTGWSEAEYTDKVNEINRKYSDILAPYFKNMTGKFGTGFGSASDAERERAYAKAAELEPVQTAELNKLYDEYQRQTSEFQKAQEDWFAQQNAESEARAKAIDEIDNEKDPYSDLIADLGELLEKLRREGKLIKGYEIVGPGEEGYVDTTNMANAIGYNRRPIYTARSEELMRQLGAAQDAQVEWMNAQQKRREAAEKADYGGGNKDAGGKPKGDGGKPKGDGGKPKGGGSQPIPMYGGGAMMGTPPSLASFLGSLSSGARKKGMRESTWDRINKYR